MSNIYSEKMIEFLKENAIYKEYNPKNYIRKMVVQKELGHIDNSLRVTKSVRPSEKIIKSYKNIKHEKELSFGVVVCIKNTYEDYLRQMIESVLTQTYEKLTLYIIDYSDRAHAYIANVCTDYEDSRVVYRKLKDGQSVCWDYFVCDYLVFLNEIDALSPIALSECVNAIEEEGSDLIYSNSAVFKKKKFNVHKCIFKPEFCPENLDTYDYIGDFFVVDRMNVNLSEEFKLTNVTESSYSFLKSLVTYAKKITRINKFLYYENIQKGYKLKINKKNFVDENPKVSVIINSSDNLERLSRVVNSILMMTTYNNYEIVIVEGSSNTDNKQVYRYFKLISSNKNIRFLRWTGENNICKIYDYAARSVKSDYFVFLDNDVEVSSYEWIEEMLVYAQEARTAFVSPKLYKNKDEIYCCGREFDFKRKNIFKNNTGKNHDFTRNVSIVTSHAFMIEREKYFAVGGFDKDFAQGFYAEDISLRALDNGFYNVYTPYASLNFYEKKEKNGTEALLQFKETWQKVYATDKFKD